MSKNKKKREARKAKKQEVKESWLYTFCIINSN